MTYHAIKSVSREPNEEMLKRLVMEHDANGDRVLSKHELKSVFKDLGSRFPGLRARLAMRFADKDKSGYIDEGELNGLVGYMMKLGYRVR
uniref:EF-hand domain-containing protein n=1 Tax=Kalanchoe fedtschenkoi TaxID=63787 RepID=A0A7N0UWY9_KALFE